MEAKLQSSLHLASAHRQKQPEFQADHTSIMAHLSVVVGEESATEGSEEAVAEQVGQAASIEQQDTQ